MSCYKKNSSLFHTLGLTLWMLDISVVLLREKMDDVTRLLDAVLPVLHEVLQRYQWVFHYWHHVFRGPGLHGNQYNPRVELLLVDLGTKNAISPLFCDTILDRSYCVNAHRVSEQEDCYPTNKALTASAMLTTALAKFLVWLLERRSCTNCRDKDTHTHTL